MNLVRWVGVSCCALSLCLIESASQTRAQARAGDLAIQGTLRVPGTRSPRSGVEIGLNGGTRFETVTTDDSGRFTFSGLAPGSYNLVPILPDRQEYYWLLLSGQLVELDDRTSPLEIDLWMEDLSRVSGRVVGADGMPITGAKVTPFQLVTRQGRRTPPGVYAEELGGLTDDDGYYTAWTPVGENYLMIDSGAEEPWFPVYYYPGTLDIGAAGTVHADHLGDLNGVDFVLPGNDTFRLRLQPQLGLPGVPGPLIQYLINIPDEFRIPFELWAWPANSRLVDPVPFQVPLESLGDGDWQTAPLPAGQYDLQLMYNPTLFAALWSQLGLELESWDFEPFAKLRVSLADRDVDLGPVPAISRVSVPGRVIIADSEDRDLAMDAVGSLVFWDDSIVTNLKHARVSANGDFILDSLHPGRYDLRTTHYALPDGWYFESIRSGSNDLLRDALVVGNGLVEPIEIIVSGDAGELVGTVEYESGAVVSGARVLLVPQDDPEGRLVNFPSTTASREGTYALRNVPPGLYRLLALDMAGRFDRGLYTDVLELLREHETEGQLISIGPRSGLTVNIEPVPVFD